MSRRQRGGHPRRSIRTAAELRQKELQVAIERREEGTPIGLGAHDTEFAPGNSEEL